MQNPISSSLLRKAYFLLFLLTILWGSTFILTKISITTVPIFQFLGIRHLIALSAFLPFFAKFRNLNRKILLGAIITGGANFIMLSFQTFGLQTTTASKASFITGLYVVLTPFLARLILHSKIKSRHWIGVLIALIGMGILIFNISALIFSTLSVNYGDFLVFICSFFVGIQIVYTEKYVSGVDILLFSMIQLFTVTICAFIMAGLLQEPFVLFDVSIDLWLIWLYLGIAATSIPFFLQNWGQQYVESSKAALIFTLEPVFATIFGILIGNETITWQFLLGGSCIFLGILFSISASRQTPILSPPYNVI
jgi:drug/metabolite transporter (DMT)-like permease